MLVYVELQGPRRKPKSRDINRLSISAAVASNEYDSDSRILANSVRLRLTPDQGTSLAPTWRFSHALEPGGPC